MQGHDLNAAMQQLSHHGGDLSLGENEIAHHHGAIRSEGSKATQPPSAKAGLISTPSSVTFKSVRECRSDERLAQRGTSLPQCFALKLMAS